MATRKIIDIEQNGEKVWPKGHAKATFMSNGTTVEDAINSIQTGTGGGAVSETDPIFSASPAASITEAKKAEWDNKVDKVSGKQLSTQDFTTELEGKLKGIEANAQKNVQSDWNENDRASDAYVNNRTHYSYDIEPVASFSVASKNEGDILVTGLSEGAFYKFYGSKSDTFYFVVGRKVIIPAYEPTIEAICAYEDDLDEYCLKLTTPTYGLTESFNLMEIHVEQLDDVYIPETIARKTEIATINGQSLTEGGDITIQGGGGGSVYKWNWNSEMYGTFTEEEFENLSNADVVYITTSADDIEVLYSVDTKVVVEDALHLGAHILSFEIGTDNNNKVAYVEGINFIFDNTSKTWNAQGGNTELITDVSNLATKDEVIFKNVVGELVTAQAQALGGGGSVYALPDQANGDEDDVLLSRGKVKTINGQDLFVDENSNDIITTYERITANSSSVELLPNSVTEWAGPVLSQELVLTFGEQPPQGYAVEYIAKFNVGADDVQLIVPDNVVWADGVYPAMTNGKTYEISFVDNLATFLEF